MQRAEPNRGSSLGWFLLIWVVLGTLVTLALFSQKERPLVRENPYSALEKQTAAFPPPVRTLLDPSWMAFKLAMNEKQAPEIKFCVRERRQALERLTDFLAKEGAAVRFDLAAAEGVTLQLSPIPSQAEVETAIATLRGFKPLRPSATTQLEAEIEGIFIDDGIPGSDALLARRRELQEGLGNWQKQPWLERDRVRMEAKLGALQEQKAKLHAEVKAEYQRLTGLALTEHQKRLAEATELLNRRQAALKKEREDDLQKNEPLPPIAAPPDGQIEEMILDNYRDLMQLYLSYQRYDMAKLEPGIKNAPELAQRLAGEEVAFQNSLSRLNSPSNNLDKREILEVINSKSRLAPSALRKHLWDFMASYLGEDENMAMEKVRRKARTLDPRTLANK